MKPFTSHLRAGLVLFILIGLNLTVHAQYLALKTGSVPVKAQSYPELTRVSNSALVRNEIVIISFSAAPALSVREELSTYFALELYLPENSWYGRLLKLPTEEAFNRWKLLSVNQIPVQWKLSPEFDTPDLLTWAIKDNEIEINVFTSTPELLSQLRLSLEDQSYRIITQNDLASSLLVQIPFSALNELAEHPLIYWIEPAPPPVESNNWVERTNHRVPMIDNIKGPYALSGKDVIVGEWDGSGAAQHIDYDARHVAMEPFVSGSNGNHATHVAGTVLSAGIRNPEAMGMAPKASLFSWDFGGFITNEMDSGARKQGIEITQNSYGYGASFDNCTRRASYDGNSSAIDQLVIKYPHLLHVFAAGNSRSSNCLSGGYGTVHSGYQAGKNTLVVAAVTRLDGNSSFHGYGPMKDGRLKPEVSAVGVDVYSTFPFDNYQGGYNGTSMACPGTSGTAALIYELYERSAGSQPPAHLIKALMSNGADDIGRPGPDYQFGFGRINAGRTAAILDKGQYRVSGISQGNTWVDSIRIGQVPQQLKVMLCWDDPQAAASASKTLVNDLDLMLITPSGDTILPWVCNPSSFTANATRLRDTLNNIEQVTLDTAQTGTYRLVVSAPRVTGSTQNFSVNWLIQDTTLYITYPNGGEQWVPPSTTATAQLIRWDAYGLSGNASLEYSTDSGATWNTIVSSVNINSLSYNWSNCPSSVRTARALIRIRLGSRTDHSDGVFSIYPQVGTLAGVVCDSQVHLSWPLVSGSSYYRVWMHENGEMVPLDTTSLAYYTVRELQNDSAYWFAVSAIGPDGAEGRRSWGVKFTPRSTNKPPRYTLQPKDSSVCQGNNAAFTMALTGTATINYTWQFSNDGGKSWQNAGVSNNPVIQLNGLSTAFNGRLYRTEAINVCQSRDYSNPALLQVDTGLQYSYMHSNIALCIGQDTAIEVIHNGVNTPDAQWFYQNTSTVTRMILNGRNTLPLRLNNVNEMHEGYYSVDLRNTCGTSQNALRVFVEIRDPLELHISGNDTICIGQRATLQARATGGNVNAYQFGWRNGNRSFIGAFAYSEPDTSETWSAFVFDACSEDTVHQIVALPVRPPLTLDFNEDTTLCQGNTVTLKAIPGGGKSQTYRYTWSEGLSNQAEHQVSPSRTTAYVLQLDDQCSKAVLRDTVVITMRDPLQVKIVSNRDTLCHTEPYTFRTTFSGGDPNGYTWNWGTGPLTDTFNTALPQSGWIRVSLNDACTVLPATDSLWMPVREALSAVIEGPDSICQTSGGIFRAMLNGGLAQGYQHVWNDITGEDTLIWAPAGSSLLRLEITDGCTPYAVPASKWVHVFDSLRLFSTDEIVDVCEGQAYTLRFNGSGGKVQQHEFLWNGNILSAAELLVQPADTAVYQITLRDGCTSPESVLDLKVQVRPKLQLDAGADTLICRNGMVERPLVSAGGLTSGYTWYVNNEKMNSGIFRERIRQPGSLVFRLEDACSKTPALDTVQVRFTDFSSNLIEILSQKNLVLHVGGSSHPHDVAWQFGMGTDWIETKDDYVHTFPNYGTFQLCRMETDPIGCSDTVCTLLRVFDAFATSGFSIDIYPNPVSDYAKVNLGDIAGNISLQLYTVDGKMLYSLEEVNFGKKTYIIPFKSYAQGVYVLRVKANAEEKVIRLVKE